MPPSACVPRRKQQVRRPCGARVVLAQGGRRLGEQVLALQQGQVRMRLTATGRGPGCGCQPVLGLLRALRGSSQPDGTASGLGAARKMARWAQPSYSQSNPILAGARSPVGEQLP